MLWQLSKKITSRVVINSSFYLAYTLTGSFFGFILWLLSAKLLSTQSVGLGAAYINIIALINFIGDLGISVVILRFLTSTEQQASHINSSAFVVILSNLFFSIIFVAGIPIWAPNMIELQQHWVYTTIFITTCIFFSLGILVDHILIAYQRTNIAWVRILLMNTIRTLIFFALLKKNVLISFAFSLGLANLITILPVIFFYLPNNEIKYHPLARINLKLLTDKATFAMGNHYFNFLKSVTPVLFPIIIINILGAQANAFFYISWMIGNAILILPTAISTTIFVDSVQNIANYRAKNINAMRLSIILVTIICPIAYFGSNLILEFINPDYLAAQNLLGLIVLSAIPYTVNTFSTNILRIEQKNKEIMIIASLLSSLSIILVIILANNYGLTGTGLAWFVVQCAIAALSLGFIFSSLPKVS